MGSPQRPHSANPCSRAGPARAGLRWSAFRTCARSAATAAGCPGTVPRRCSRGGRRAAGCATALAASWLPLSRPPVCGGSVAPVNVGASVARIVQDGERVAVGEFAPEQSRREPPTTAARKLQALAAQRFDDRDGRAQPPEGFKQQPDALLHLLVWIENHLRVVI